MKTKKIILSLLLIIVIITIFIFSSQNATTSEHISDTFASKIIDKTASLANKKISAEKKKEIIIKTRVIVRKSAHFTVYFTLGILVYLILKTYNINSILKYSIVLCFLFACSDEIHQLFSAGRTARVYDIIIDSLGSILGILLIRRITTKTRKKTDQVF